jgi:DnaJ-class molecular chaperone
MTGWARGRKSGTDKGRGISRPCPRCQGSGRRKTRDANGKLVDSPCPICAGTGRVR